MPNISLVQKLFAVSPHFEMIGRRIYWNNVKWLSNNERKKREKSKSADLNKIVDSIKRAGVEKGALLLVHSAFRPLKATCSSPNEIINSLQEIIGATGTLAMPAMPQFDNSPDITEYIKAKTDELIFEYDVQKSPIKTGVLPQVISNMEGATRSRHPINSMVAIGPLSEKIMKDNLAGPSPTACGENSSWKKCVDHDAYVVSIGTDLTHSLTMIHVVEDCLDDKWPIKNWYQYKRFIIKDGTFIENRVLRERKPEWGALHFGERTLCKDLIECGIMKSEIIDGIIVEILRAKDLITFLNSKNSSGYPYFWVNT